MRQRIFLTLITVFSSVYFGYSQLPEDLQGYKTDNDNIFDICLSANGQVIGITDNDAIKVFNTNTRELLAEFKDGHTNLIQAIDISNDSTLLVSGGRDSTIVIWDFQSKRKLKTLTFHDGIITSVKLSSCGRYMVSGGTDKIFLYDNEKEKVIRELDNHCDVVTAVTFSPDAKIFASSGAGKSIYIYETQSGKIMAEWSAHKNWVRSVSFSKDGTRLISCGDDSRVRVWDISNLNNIHLITDSRHGFDWILSADLNKDNDTYAFGNYKGNVKIIHQFGFYKANLRVPVTRILFVPKEDTYLQIVVATRGKGVVQIDAVEMKPKMK